MVLQFLVLLAKKHVPLIKFRKGGLIPKPTPTFKHDKFVPAQIDIPKAKQSAVALEDTELPARYFRKPMEESEIEAINQGGAPYVPLKSVAKVKAVLESWELPDRYKRKPIDQTELEYINRGGPP